MTEAERKILKGMSEDVAPRLLGCLLVYDDGETRLSGRIVETEAYGQTDAASHSYKGRTPRSEVMFGPAGHLYVYFTYGMHYCCNVVTGPAEYGSAVLIRAIEPLEGADVMQQNRGGRGGVDIANGPAKMCQAFRIDKEYNGHDLTQAPLQLIIKPPVERDKIVTSGRIGISQARDVPWRFYERGNPYVSKPAS